MPVSKSDTIAIVGGGAFGLSTAFHLSRSGYTNISVFEQDTQIPPRQSAANDLNKIVRAEYEDAFWTDLTMLTNEDAQKAIAEWKTPLFAPYFHQTGFLHCVSGNAPRRAIDTLKRFQEAAQRHPELRRYLSSVNGGADVHDLVYQYKNGPAAGWHGYMNRYDGYAHSGNALAALYRETQKSGVRFYLGEKGAISEIAYDGAGQERRSQGVRNRAGQFHEAKLVIVAVGAAVNKLIPEVGTQVVAKSWSVAHVQLTDDETSALRGVPVTYARDLGFFFEPDPKTNLLKLCPMGGGFVNTDPQTGVSLPPPNLEDSAFMPPHDQSQVRKLLAATLPTLKDRPLVRQQLCWFADTADSDFIIDYAPQTSSSVVVLSGDSGHAFKMFPLLGSWAQSLIESPSAQQSIERWRWKAPASKGGDANWGDSVSWRLGETLEYRDIRPSVRAKL